MKKSKNIFNQYIGEYVIIYPKSGYRNFAGKLIDVQGEFAILNPHQSGFVSEKGLVRKMIDKNSIVNISDIDGVEPTTKESLENACEIYNKNYAGNIPFKKGNGLESIH